MKPFKTYRNPALSLWQSAVLSTIKTRPKQKNLIASSYDPAGHPMMTAALTYCDSRNQNADLKEPRMLLTKSVADDTTMQAFLCGSYHQLGQAIIQSDLPRQEELKALIKKYSIFDVFGWEDCLNQYLKYYTAFPGSVAPEPLYRSWKTIGNGDINFGVIGWKLPKDGKVGVVADWATGEDEAVGVLKALCALEPDVIVNLGDTYYSGVDIECRDNVLGPFSNFAINPTTKNKIPVFCIPGNHDYYSGGVGFHQMLDELCKGTNAQNASPGQVQNASYFCLRNEDNTWQLLGMDTGYGDHNAFAFLKDIFEDTKTMPGLPPDELQWHVDKIMGFPGKTILLSHHQLYSSNGAIGAPQNQQSVNDKLFESFAPYFAKIPVWLWGHEHNLAIFGSVQIDGYDAAHQLQRGRCVGHGAIPVNTLFETPYAINFPRIPVQATPKLSSGGGWFNHGFELLQFDSAAKKLQINYHEVEQATGTSKQLWSETI